MRSLSIRAEIQDALQRSRHERFVAVHIRRGDDIVRFIKERTIPRAIDNLIATYVSRYADVESYRIALEGAAPAAPILIFSNLSSESEALRRALLDRQVVTMDDLSDCLDGLLPPRPKQWGLGIQRDFVGQLIMAETQRIIGPNSNYSNFARLLGGNRVVRVDRWLNPPTMIAEVEREFSDRSVVASILNGYAKAMRLQSRPDAAAIFSARADASAEIPDGIGLSARSPVYRLEKKAPCLNRQE
jgi:hypothetical protein